MKYLAMTVLRGCFSMPGCSHTFRGTGKDLQETGKSIEDTGKQD
jgi:predicted small secreted protein